MEFMYLGKDMGEIEEVMVKTDRNVIVVTTSENKVVQLEEEDVQFESFIHALPDYIVVEYE